MSADAVENTPLLGLPASSNGPPKTVGPRLSEMHIQIKEVTFQEGDDEDSSLDDVEVPDWCKEKPLELGKPSAGATASTSSGRSWLDKIDINAFQFALRMGVMLTFTSLFVLVRTPKFQYPAGMWVLVSTLFVCWFPALDAASVIEKIVQRLIGTFVGAFLGLGCGFLSLLFGSETHQAIFIGLCMFVFCFLIIFLAGQCKVGQVKVIRKYAYATILCVLTFCIALLPFATDPDPKYERAVYRVMNVIVGCAIGASGAIVVCPKSTQDVLREKTIRQVKMAGDACEAVMELAADYMGGQVTVRRLADELVSAPLDTDLRWRFHRSDSIRSQDSVVTAMKRRGATDVALKKYEEAIADWKQCKMLFPLIKYDPFSLFQTYRYQPGQEEKLDTARILARTLRIQTTVVMIDGMIRSDADYELDADDLFMFREIGTCIHQSLQLPIEPNRNARAARKLFDYLELLRKRLTTLRHETVRSQLRRAEREGFLNDFYESVLGMRKKNDWNDSIRDDLGRGLPKNLTESDENTLFFLQLVEHLVLRALRLYQSINNI